MGTGSSGARQNLKIDAGDELTLNVEVSGEGPPILLLHGFTGSTKTWSDLRSRLDKSHKVVAVDLPGHGQSSSPSRPERYGLNRLSDDLERVLDDVGIASAIVLGYSMGGRASLRFALDKPQKVSGLVLESTSSGIDDPAEREARIRADEDLARFIDQEGVEAFVKRWETLPIWESQRSLSLEKVNSLRRQRLDGDAAGLANSLRGAGAGRDEPVTSRLPEITAPVLLVAGSLDTKYVRIMTAMHAAIAGSRLAVIDGAGHVVHLERPDDFTREVSHFVNEVHRV